MIITTIISSSSPGYFLLKWRRKELDEHLAARTACVPALSARQAHTEEHAGWGGAGDALDFQPLVLPLPGAPDAVDSCSFRDWDHCSLKPGKYSEVRPDSSRFFQRMGKRRWGGREDSWFSFQIDGKRLMRRKCLWVNESKQIQGANHLISLFKRCLSKCVFKR